MSAVLTVVATIRAAKGKGDALAALLAEQAAVVRKEEPGCLAYRPHRSTQDPDLFLFYETYVNYEHLMRMSAEGDARHEQGDVLRVLTSHDRESDPSSHLRPRSASRWSRGACR